MFKRIIFIVLLVLWAGELPAQNRLSGISKIDSLTYAQYLKGDWNALIKTAEKARKNGVDFYYLDVRQGIAYYHLGKYRKAVVYLQKAYDADEKNQVVAEFLYYSYVYAGRYLDARRVSDLFKLELKEKLGLLNNRLFEWGGIDFKIDFIDDYSVDSQDDELNQNVITDKKYIGFELYNYLGKADLMVLNAGKLYKDYTQYSVADGEQQAERKSMTQTQYYLGYYSQIGTGWNLGFAVNWLRSNYDGIQYRMTGRGGNIRAVPVTQTINEWVGFAGLRRDMGNFKLGLTASVSDLQEYLQLQPATEITWYPIGNSDLYIYSVATYKMEMQSGDWYNETVLKSGLGFRLAKIYWEPSYTYGNMYNFVEKDALVVYNDNEKTTARVNLLAYKFLMKGKLKIYAQYQWMSKTNYYQLNDTDQSIDYNNQSITTGILWKF